MGRIGISSSNIVRIQQCGQQVISISLVGDFSVQIQSQICWWSILFPMSSVVLCIIWRINFFQLIQFIEIKLFTAVFWCLCFCGISHDTLTNLFRNISFFFLLVLVKVFQFYLSLKKKSWTQFVHFYLFFSSHNYSFIFSANFLQFLTVSWGIKIHCLRQLFISLFPESHLSICGRLVCIW